MKYIIRFFVALVILFVFFMNIIANILLWSEFPKFISIMWLIATIMSFLLKLNYFELLVVKAKKFLMMLATDTIDYYKKGVVNE